MGATVGAMQVPEDLAYSTDHEWVRRDGPVARVGITEYAQDALGDVVFVQLPAVGSVVVAGGALGEVESTKSVSDVFAPVSGTITAVNDTLVAQPELLNQDPYGDGWICEITAEGDADFADLMDAAAYRTLVEG